MLLQPHYLTNMKFTTLCLVLFVAVVCLEALPTKIENKDEQILEESDTSACPYEYYLWGKKYTIFCDPFCANYNKIAACVNGTCQCLKKPKTV